MPKKHLNKNSKAKILRSKRPEKHFHIEMLRQDNIKMANESQRSTHIKMAEQTPHELFCKKFAKEKPVAR